MTQFRVDTVFQGYSDLNYGQLNPCNPGQSDPGYSLLVKNFGLRRRNVIKLLLALKKVISTLAAWLRVRMCLDIEPLKPPVLA